MARQLKVFSTPAGFFNAVVAAPSQKAALEAWGLRENVFANGSATVVTDPELIAKALDAPGEIVRVPVGTDAAILAGVKRPPKAAPEKKSSTKPKADVVAPARASRPAPPPPPPDCSALDAAEAALRAAEDHLAKEEDRLSAELQKLQDEQAAIRAELTQQVERATAKRDAAARSFRTAGGREIAAQVTA